MVFESIVAEVLNRILGDYVENLDAKQLNIGIWGGDVMLQNLQLKQTALEDLDLPIQTVYGRLGKLVLKIPWKNLYGAPVEAIIERLYLLVVPNLEIKYNAEKEEKLAQDIKQADLERIEQAKKKAAQKFQPKVDDTFAEKLVTQIIKNIQIKIKNIHIRYEDSITNPGKPFAFGITLNNLSVESTNSNWAPTINTDVLSKIFKILNLDALAVYWNCNCKLYSNMEASDILEGFETGIASKDVKPLNYTYVLGPINSSARLRLNPKPENDTEPFSISKVLLNLEMEKLAIGLTKLQYQEIMLLVESMDRMSRGMPYRKYRPFVKSYKGYYAEWWKFALTCVLEEEVRRRRRNWDWEHICNHRSTCKTYAQAYKNKLINKKISAADQEILKNCETSLDVFNLVLIRQRIELEVERLAKETEENKKKKGSWLGSWWGRPSTSEDKELSTTADILKKFEEAMTPAEKAKLYKAIDYQENSAPAVYPNTFVATNCAFLLRCLEVQILDDTRGTERVLSTELKGVNCRFQQRPADKSIKVAVKIDEFTVFGVKQDNVTPFLVSSEDFSKNNALLDVMFETNPIDKTCDQRLHIKSLPLRVVYDAQTIIQIVDFFKTPKTLALNQLQSVAESKLADFREMSAFGIQHAIEKHDILDLDVTLSAPYIVIPYKGLFTNTQATLVVNLGNVKMKSVSRENRNLNIQQMHKEGTTEDEILKHFMSQSYDKFCLELSDMQVLIAHENEKWKQCIFESIITPMHILNPLNLTINIEKCLFSDDPRLPKIKIRGELPSLSITASDDRVLSILSVLTSIPFPGNDEEIEPPTLYHSLSTKGSMLSLQLPDIHRKIEKKEEKIIDVENFTQATDLDMKFEMKELSITLLRKKTLKHASDDPVKFIEFRSMILEFEMLLQTYNLNVNVRLGGIELNQYLLNEELKIITTPMTTGLSNYLFIIQYHQVKSNSPEFHSKYRSCEQFLQLNFSNLQLQLHQEALQNILQVTNDIHQHMNKIIVSNPKQDRISVINKQKIGKQLSVIEENLKAKKLSVPKKKYIFVETIQFKLCANFNELDILIANSQRQLANFIIKGIETKITVKKSYTQITANLVDLILFDMNPHTIHNKILCKQGTDDAIQAQIVLYNIDKTVDLDKNDISIYASTSCLKITFLNLFVTSILDFLNNFQAAQERIIEASAVAAEVAKIKMETAYENATKIDMNIKLKAPEIIIPTNSLSYDAIVFDLGYIELKNNFLTLDVVNEAGHSAIIDELKVSLMEMKVSRVLLDDRLQINSECVLLKPLSLTLLIKRNLSTSWYSNIPDIDVVGEMKSIELMLSHADYIKIFDVLTGNLAEGPDKKQKKENIPTDADIDIKKSKVLIEKKSERNISTILKSSDQVHTFFRFTFTMESLIINLFKGGSKMVEIAEINHAAKNGLARFILLVFSVKGRILTNNSIVTSVVLVDCLLDDTRDGREGKLTRLMERKESHAANDTQTQSMIDVTLKQENTNTFVDVRVCSFNLILSTDYLMKIAAFFSLPENKNTNTEVVKTNKTMDKSKNEPKSNKSRTTLKPVNESCFTLNLKVEKPDIILVESMDDINTAALILNSEVLLNLKMTDVIQSIRGSINNFQLYTCCYNPAKRNETKCSVLRSCDVVVHGATPSYQGLHLDITLSAIRLSVSPAVIELLSNIQKAMSSASTAEEDDSQTVTYYDNIWNLVPFKDSDHWFLKTEEGQDVMEIMSLQNNADIQQIYLKELCSISALTVIITIEAGVGNKTLPMLLLETNFEATINDWSSKLYIESSLTLQMTYYNSRLAVWEPLIEPVEVLQNNEIVHKPWELKVELRKNEREESNVTSPQLDDDTIEEITFMQPAISINVFSSVNLEMVVTKTMLEVLSNLGNAFTDAMKVGIPIRDSEAAPYKVINDSGLKVTVILNDTFELHHVDHNKKQYKEVLLESGTELSLDIKSEEYVTAFNTLMQSEERILTILVNDMNCTLKLPVTRADKRYFPLNYRGENNDGWGIISDITVEGAETIITLRSILQIHNYFNQSVNIYYMMNRDNEVEVIASIPPNGKCNVPLHAVYTKTNELFFSVEGHCVSAKPYVWKDVQHNLSVSKVLVCPCSSRPNQPFVMKVFGDIEQVFYENTRKHTMSSTCYNIHVRPAVTFKNCLPIPILCIAQENIFECTVNPGEQVNMPTMNPGSSYVIIKLNNYLEKQWSCRHEILSNPAEFSVWQFNSYDSSAKIQLDLGMHCLNKNGTQIFSLYCPFWMLNKTGLMLSYRKSSKTEKNQHYGSPSKSSDEGCNVLHHPEDYQQPILFSFNAKNFFGKKKASIRIENGEWCDKFSLDVAGSTGMVVCKSNNFFHQIGVHNQLTYNGLTKQVTFTPYYVLINNTLFGIECQELERPADPWVVVDSNSCTPLWPKSERDDKLLKIRIIGTKDISAPFFITEIHTTLLKLHNQYGGINVDVQITEGGIYIKFTQYQLGLAPALILNHTSKMITLWEKESVNVKKLPTKHKFLYTWENPTGPRLLVWEAGKKKEIENDLRRDGLGEFTSTNTGHIYWVSFLDGMQRVLLFTEDPTIARDAESAGDLETIDQEITISIHGLGISLVNNLIRQEIMYMGIASSGVIWEASKISSKRFKQLSVKECTLIEAAYKQYLATGEDEGADTVIIDPKTEVDFKNELMLRPHKRRLRRTFQTGLWLQMKTSSNQMQLHAKINRIQIDNQVPDCGFPVILAPVPPPKSVAADSTLKPFAEVSIVQRIMQHSNVQQYKYFKVLIQEFHVKVDLGFVNALMSIFEEKQQSEEEEALLFKKDVELVSEPLMSHISIQTLKEQINFYDFLHFSPLKIHVSFSLATPHDNGSGTSAIPAFMNILLQGLGVTLTDMQDVVFRLAYFEREYSFLSQKQLVSEATSHYVGQALKQLYVLVLGLDVIGNPYGLVLGISKGVEDLFYEPFQGAIQGPGEFAEGLVLGVRSLFGHTVGGAAGAVSKITGAMGKGIAALTFDKDYQRKRRDQINKKPANIQEGIARGGKGLVMGVVDGVTGVFTKPISGAKEQGVEGFFKGLGKGAVGLVTRPTAGVIDFASGSLDAVKRATEIGDDIYRLRPARFIRADGLVRPYIRIEAEGNKLLKELEKGKYANTDIYVYHTWIIEEKDILLLTDKRIAYVVHNDIFGGWQMEWSYTWNEIKTPVKIIDKGIQIQSDEPKKKVLGLFGSSDNGKIILITDPLKREFIKNKIESIRQSA